MDRRCAQVNEERNAELSNREDYASRSFALDLGMLEQCWALSKMSELAHAGGDPDANAKEAQRVPRSR